MQRDFLPNAYRGINELSSSQSSNEPMDVDNNVHQSIIQQVDNDQIDSSKRNHITNRSLFKSIVQTPDNDIASYTQLPLVNTANNESSSAQATGLDPNFSAAIDADEALARELQQKEYSRDSIIPNRHPYERFRIPSDDEIRVIDPAHNSEPDVMPNFNTDEEFAAYLQAQENRKRERFHRRQFPFFPVPPRPTPTSENGQPPNDLVFPGQIRFRPSANDEDDEDNDDDEYRTFHMNDVHPLFRLLGNPHFNHEGISPFMLGHRRNYRRTGNLQDTEDDFGPEDYERLLQLDDTIRKKKLSQSQINSIKEVLFHSNAKNTDEENKCGVCLEHFEENQTLRQFPCSHVYHKQCADRWLRENNVCPICRKPPVDIQSSSSNSRHHHHHKSSNNTSRRPQAANRSSTNRQHSTHNSSTMSTNSQSRRGPPFQRPS